MNRSRPLRIQFHVSQDELDAIERKQAAVRMPGREAFMRRLVLEGQVLVLNIPELRQISALLGHCSGNLNQIARRVNGTGRYDPGELREVKQSLNAVEQSVGQLIEQMTRINR